MREASLHFRVDGLEKVIAEIARRQMDARRSLRAILNPGARIIRDEIRSRGVGRFRRQIRSTVRVNMSRMEAVARIGPAKPHAHIAGFVEFGTRPHIIRATSGKRLYFGGRFVRSVRHPGARAKPFIQPGFEASKDKAVAAVADAAKALLGA